ncbi:MAG: S-methyl-5-thioribose-1-phosphate isomerase [Actinobacteria bacterium]|nr:S-methyl-5-thioribose-1-phosphate isomerase [Actinomycetota bacterium]
MSGRIVTREPGDSVFFRDGRLFIIDQTALPAAITILELHTPEDVAGAIRRLAVRGAMAIGVAGAYGVLLGALQAAGGDVEEIRRAAAGAVSIISASRPTAVNLFWACERMENALEEGAEDSPDILTRRLGQRADEIALHTIESNRKLVEAGQEVVGDGAGVLTHCNSGPLAAIRHGTAVGVLIEAHRRGKGIHVYVDETRPLLQGARLTAWELDREGVPYTLITDSTAAQVMRRGSVDLVITGADRIAANGDTANKIGTYGLAVLAGEHGIPFYIAAPGSTVDLECAHGSRIVIEERDADEVRTCAGRATAPPGSPVYNPAFDVTPAKYISGIITERGVLRRPYEESLHGFGE